MINSLLLLFSLNLTLYPQVETDPSPYPGDSVDDPAIWYNEDHPEQSVVLGTLKASNLRPVQPTGILVYDLQGREIQFLSGGTPNNIDLRRNFPAGSKHQTLIAASHWYSEKVGLYEFDPETRQLSLLKLFTTGVRKLRGLCMAIYQDQFYYFAVGSSGDIEQYRVDSLDEVTLVNRWELDSEAEGCVADDQRGLFYVAEENHGIWKIQLDPSADTTPILIDEVGLFSPIKRGLEGMAILENEAQRYLIVSVQEKSRFAIYRLPEEVYLGSFVIKSEDGIDGVTKTDGIDIFNGSLGPDFPEGLIVVQDDRNEHRPKAQNQNFKFISRQLLLDALEQIEP